MKAIGVLGGTFNPVHNGHLAVADEVRRHIELDEVIFMPAGRPWMKEGEAVADAGHRLGMLRLALEGKSVFSLSTMETERPGFTYTVDTITRLRDSLGEDTEIYFILSWGTLSRLPEWREPERLIRMCRLAVVPRPDYPRPDVEALNGVLPGLSGRLNIMDKPLVDISSSEVRRRVAAGLDIGWLVPAAVAEYIKEKGIYRAEESS